MRKNYKKLYIGIFIAIFFLISFLVFPTWRQGLQVGLQVAETATNTESITVLAGDTTAHLLVAPNTLFYDALVQEKNTGKIALSGKNYPGLGFFVTDIGSLHAGSGKSLLYYINGKEATVGVSSYTLKDGDIIEWKLK